MTRTRTLAALLLASLSLSGCAVANAVAIPKLRVSPYPPPPGYSVEGRVWADPYIAAPPVEAPEEGP